MKSNFIFSDFSFELQVLIRAGEAALDKTKKTQLEALIQDKAVDWDTVYHLACLHQIRPLLLRGVSGLQNGRIPSPILQKLKAACLQISARNLANTNEMLRLLELFKQHDILAVPYKGAYLTNKYYGDFGMREFSDIDLFVHEENIPKIKQILSNDDYNNYYTLTTKQEAWNHKIDYDYTFLKSDKNGNRLFHLEIHYRTTPSYYMINMNIADFPNAITENTFLSKSMKTLSNEAHLAFIFTHHGIKESWSKLKYLFDLKLIISEKDLDWKHIIENTNRFKITPMLFTGIRMVEIIFYDFIVENIPKLYSNTITHNLADRLLNKVNSYNGYVSNMHLHWQTLSFRMHYDKRPSMVLNHLKPLIIPSKTDFGFIKSTFLPTQFYYMVRPIRMVFEFFSGIFKRS
jgi:hypothetical protein